MRGELADASQYQDCGAGFRQAGQPVCLICRAGDAKNLQGLGEGFRGLGGQWVFQQNGTVRPLPDADDEGVAGGLQQVPAMALSLISVFLTTRTVLNSL